MGWIILSNKVFNFEIIERGELIVWIDRNLLQRMWEVYINFFVVREYMRIYIYIIYYLIIKDIIYMKININKSQEGIVFQNLKLKKNNCKKLNNFVVWFCQMMFFFIYVCIE